MQDKVEHEQYKTSVFDSIRKFSVCKTGVLPWRLTPRNARKIMVE